MFRYIGVESKISNRPDEIEKAKKILLPGVGKFDTAMEKIKSTGLSELLYEKVLIEKTPILGVCLGMQLLTEESEEGSSRGFGWIPSTTLKFKFGNNNYKIPHMGWNKVRHVKSDVLTEGFAEESKFYFVHSYYVKVQDEKNSLLKTNYGGIEFDSAIQNENIWGTQFHPEKSHKYGMKLLENFAKI